MKRSLLILAFFALFFSACTSKRSHDVDFYYWKSKCAIGETERDYFNQLGSKRLFVRLFDVAMEGGRALPVGPIQGFGKEQLPNDSTKVIPVVFITNQTFYDYVNQKQEKRRKKPNVLLFAGLGFLALAAAAMAVWSSVS